MVPPWTPASSTTCRAGARATSRSARTGTCWSIPTATRPSSIDLKELIDRLQLRGLDLPILLRFNGILKDRLREIHDVFAQAIKEHDYKGTYACVYPIKVNQQRQVVEKIIEYGKPYGFGLEAGSKPELLAVVAMTDADTPIICNGFKDAEFIEMAHAGPEDRPARSSPSSRNTPSWH